LIIFSSEGWEDYLHWQQFDKKILKKINELIKDTRRDPFNGLGKPEPLKHNYAGFWSRRISDEHRLVYSYENHQLTIIACRNHY